MPKKFEVLDLDAIEKGLRIEVGPGVGSIANPPEPETDIYVKPPLTEEEQIAILESVGPESELGSELVAGTEMRSHWVRFTVDGETSERHLALGIKLAEEAMALKGLRAALVVSEINRKLQQHLVLAESTETN